MASTSFVVCSGPQTWQCSQVLRFRVVLLSDLNTIKRRLPARHLAISKNNCRLEALSSVVIILMLCYAYFIQIKK